MVAFVSGDGLGLSNSSLEILGAQGAVGDSELGRVGDQVFVNVATGNVVVQRQDDFLSVLGQDISVTRTYNSLGLADGDNNDGWRMGLVKIVSGLTGTLNAGGSTVSRTDADGHVSVYTWNSGMAAYVTNEGAGAYDTLKFTAAVGANPASWTWTDGATQQSETYDWGSYTYTDDRAKTYTTNVGKIVASCDADGNKLTYQYQAYTPAAANAPAYANTWLLASVTTDSLGANGQGDKVEFAWTGGKLQSVTSTAEGVARQSVTYTYDANNRLQAVNVATAAAGQWSDAVNVTTFSYYADGTIQSITEDDGSQVTFAYSNGKVSNVSQTINGVTRSSGITYTSSTGTVADADGNTVITFDTLANDYRLKSVKLPGTELFQYAYDTSGNLTKFTDARGLSSTFGSYDTRGNQGWAMDAAGNVVTRTWSASNQLLSETSYLVPDADALGTPAGATPVATQYVRDAEGHLRFIVSAQDRVTEYRYDAQGRRTAEVRYDSGLYTAAMFDEASLAAWAAGQDAAKTQVSETSYDYRGNVTAVRRYPAGGTQGVAELTQYTYDRWGRLLTTTSAEGAVTSYTYDAFGRIATATNADGATIYVYDDAQNKVSVTRTEGSTVVSMYNAAGDLLSVATSAAAMTATELYAYDAKGRLRMTTDATGVRSYILYDPDGRKVADIDATGSLVEYAYNANGQVITTTRYANAISPAQLASLVDANGRPANVTLASVRPAANASLDQKSWNLYDNAGRLAKTVSATGSVTETQYDGASRVVATIEYATAVAVGSITAATKPTDAIVSATSALDQRTRLFYDDDGLLLATLDPAGALTENLYDNAGQLFKTVRYFALTASASRATGTLAQLRPAADAQGRDVTTFQLRDGEGRVVAALDAENFFTATTYDREGRVLTIVRYATPSTYATASITGTTAASAVNPGGAAATTQYAYDDMGRVTWRKDADGSTTTYTYDALGRLKSTKLNAGTAVEQDTLYTLDELGRVKTETSPGGQAVQYQYDLQGRRLSVTDANGKRTLFYYDADGHLTYTVNALGEVVWDTYDNLGQLAQSRRLANRLSSAQLAGMSGGWAASVAASISALASDAIDRKIAYSYTLEGRIAATTDEMGIAATASYAATGTAQYTVDANGNATRYVYDANVRLVFELDATNAVVGYTYDAAGRVLKTTRYASAVSSATVPPNVKGPVSLATLTSAVAAIADATRDVSITNVYDDKGNAVFTVSGAGAVTARTFDAFGNVIAQTSYAARIAVPATLTVASVTQAAALVANAQLDESSWSAYDAAGRLTYRADGTGSVSTFAYDAGGRLTEKVTYANKTAAPSAHSLPVPDPAHDARVRMFYDADGRLTKTATASALQGGVLMWSVTTNAYDGAGRVLSTTAYATLQAHPAANTAESPAVSAQDRTVRTVYDALGQAVYQIDAEGAVTANTFDTAGHIIQARRYAAPVTVSDKVDAQTVAGLLVAGAQDTVHRTVYDSAGRAAYAIDSFGAVTQYTYDAAGHVTQTRQYAVAITISGNPTVSQMAAAVTTNAADRVTRTVYDAAGRATWTIDGQGAVTANTYDAQGRLVATREYAQSISIASLAIGTAPNMTGVADAANDRFTQYAYDAEGRLAWRVDAGGYLTQTLYDAQGRVAGTKLYATPIGVAVGTVLTLAAIESFASTHLASGDQTTATAYDAAGRVKSATDANGGVEQFTYDGLGQVASRTDKRGFVWTTSYDAAGRVVSQRSPLVDIAWVGTGANGAASIDGVPQRAVETVTAYNAFGEVSSRTEAYGTPQARTTAYAYDRMGRQVQTTFPQAAIFDGAIPTSQLGTTTAAPQVNVLYDAQGHAVRNTAANGSRGWRIYDAEGRLAFEIDGLGYVTGYTRNGFGEVTALTRFAAQKAVAGDTVPTLAQMQAFATTGTHTADRTIATSYDNAGRVVKVLEPSGHYYDAATGTHNEASKATATTYNAFGEVLKQSVYGQLASGSVIGATANTYFSWNVRGLQAARIDIVERSGTTDKGYATAMTYDAAGRVVDTTEYATKQSYADSSFSTRTGMAAVLGASADDRRVQYAYDKSGNLLAETRVGVGYSTASNGTQVTGNVTTTYTYDAEGHLLSTVDATGAATWTAYDALGRATAVATYSVDARKRQVAQVYLALLGRAPTAAELADGITKAPIEVAQAIVATANGKTASQYLADLFANLVARAPDAGAQALYLPQITAGNRAQFALDMIGRFNESMNQDTAMMAARTGAAVAGTSLAAATSDEQRRITIAALYAAVLGRAPDASGMSTYMSASFTYAQIADAMFASPEGQALYPLGTTAWELAARLYQATRGSAADTATVASLALQATDTRGNWGAFALAQVNTVLGGTGTALAYFTDKMMAGLPEGADVYGTPGTLSKLLLDAYGNVVQKIDYAAGAVDGIDVFQATAGADRTTYTQYDASGHAVREWDALGNATTTAYDIDGHAVATLRVGTSNGQAQSVWEIRKYDALGRLVETDKPGEAAGDAKVVTTLAYNAFGELTSRKVDGVEIEYADWDNAGHLWRGNAGDGVDKVFLYDAFGNRTGQVLDEDDSLRSVASVVVAVTGNHLIQTGYVYDLQGHVVTQKNPTQYASDIGVNGATPSATAVVTSQTMTLGYEVMDRAQLQEFANGEGSPSIYRWVGTNTVRLSWSSLGGLGAGDVRIELTYTDADGAAQTLVRDVGADTALTGNDLSWDDAAPLQSLQSVRVFKKSLAADWQILINSTSTGQIGTILRIDAPADPNAVTQLQYRATGASAWTTAANLPRFGDSYVFDMSGFAEGTYEYQVSSAGVVRDTGSVGVVNQRLREQIARLYAGLLNRSADATGMATYLSWLGGGSTLANVAAGFYQSTEQNLSTMSATQVVNFILANALHNPSPAIGGELFARSNIWSNQLGAQSTALGKGGVLASIFEEVAAYTGSDADMIAARDLMAKKTTASLAYAVEDGGYQMTEALAMMAQLNTNGDVAAALAIGHESWLRRQVTQLYVAILDRAPDAAGLVYQTGEARTHSLSEVAQAVYTSPEAKGDLLYWNANGTAVSDTQLVTAMFQRAGRTASAADLTRWTTELQSKTRGQVFVEMANYFASYASADVGMLAARQLFNNKVSIGLTYASEVGGSLQGAEEGLMACATADATALQAAQAAVNALNQLASNAQTAESTMAIVAASAPMEEYRRQIAQLYATLLDRVPDAAGMTKYYEDMEFRGLSLEDTANALVTSPEGTPLYGSLSNSAFASSIFTKVYGRAPTASELSYWSGKLPGWSRGQVARSIIESLVNATDAATLSARQLLANKAAVGVMWSVDLGGSGTVAQCKQMVTLTTASDTTSAVNYAVTTLTTSATADARAAQAAAQAARDEAITAYNYTDALAAYMSAADTSAAIVPSTQSEQFTQLAQMYVGICNRAVSNVAYTELDWHFTNEFQAGMTQVQVADAFFQSAEGLTAFPTGMTATQVVTKIYNQVLGRAPDAAGLNTWTAALNANQTRGKVFVDIVNSFLGYSGTMESEYSLKAAFQQKISTILTNARNAATAAGYSATKLGYLNKAASKEAADASMYSADTQRCSTLNADNANGTASGDALTYTQLEQLYLGGLGREGSLNELIYYTNQLKTSQLFTSLDNVAQAFVESSEGVAKFGGLSNDAFISLIYQQTFGRDADSSGLTTWRNRLTSGWSRGKVMRGIIDSLVNYAGSGTNASEMARKATFLGKVKTALANRMNDANAYVADPYGVSVTASTALGRQLATSVDLTEVQALNASTEAKNRKTILQLYTLLFNAAPSQAQMNTWVAQMGSGASSATITAAMLATPEGLAKYPAGTSANAFVTSIFQGTLGRPPTAANLNAYNTGTLAQIAVSLVTNITGYTGTAASDITLRVILTGKVMVNAKLMSAGTHDVTVAAQTTAAEAAKVLTASVKPVGILRAEGWAGSSTGLQQESVTPTIAKTYDRWGNVKSESDARNASWLTTYSYNALNEVTTIKDALNNTTQLYYDAAGRNVATRDARGNVNGLVYDALGHVVEEIHADGATVQSRYSAFGDKLVQRGGDGTVTAYGYDALGHVTSLARGGNVGVDAYATSSGSAAGAVGSWNPVTAAYVGRTVLTERYTYDAFGRRTSYVDASGYASFTYYDLRGNVNKTVDALNRTTSYDYDLFDRKIQQTYQGGIFEQWSYDTSGRLAGHRDMKGGVSGYTYNDHTGWLIKQDSTWGQQLYYTYDASSGLLLKIEDKSVTGKSQVTQYAYDASGRHIREKTATIDTGTDLEVDVAQDNHIAYDELGRTVHVQDGRYDITWTYDAVGNRVSQRSRFRTSMDDGTEQVTDRTTYNAFDSMNREVLVNGGTPTGITGDATNSQGQQISYDGAGNRIHVTQWGKGLALQTSKVIMGMQVPVKDGTFAATSTNIVTSETSFYDAAGRLQTMYREGAIADARKYDKTGHVLETGQIGLDDIDAAKFDEMGISAQSRLSAYDAGGQLVQQAVLGQNWRTNDDAPEATVGYTYDALGRVSTYDTSFHKSGYARHYDYTYTNRDANSILKIEVRNVIEGVDADHPIIEADALAKTTNTFDANGRLIHVEGTDPKDTRDLVNDAQGRVLRKTQYTRTAGGVTGNTVSTIAHQTRTLIVNGEEIGSTSSDTDVKDTFNKDYVQTGSFSGNTFYTVQAGDTLQGIAQAFYGDSNLWYLIADANGTSTVTAGSVILVPAKASTSVDNASTTKLYDPSKAIGDLTPTAPPPQGQGGGCGGIGRLLELVVAIVATVYLGPIAGNLAGQLTAIADGNQNGINWKSVALSAVSAGVTQGLDAAGMAVQTTNATVNAVANAAIANTVTQAIATATGLQKSFSWQSVAASAVGAKVGLEVGSAMGLGDPGFAHRTWGEKFWAMFVTGAAAGGAAALAGGGRVTAQQVALQAFGGGLHFGVKYGFNSGALGQGLLDQSQPQTQGGGPYSDSNYVNGMDLASDQAYETRRSQEWIEQSDRIQATRLGERFARHQAELADLGGRMIQGMPVSGYDQYVKEMTPINRPSQALAQTNTETQVAWGGGAGGGRGFVNPTLASDINLSGLERSAREVAQWQRSSGRFDPGVDWIAPEENFQAKVANVMDNLAAQGKAEPGLAGALAAGINLQGSRAGYDDPVAWRTSINADARLARIQSGIAEPGGAWTLKPYSGDPRSPDFVGPLQNALGRPTYLTPTEFNNLPANGTLDPRVVRYSQDSAGGNFRPPFGSVDEFAQGLSNGTIKAADVAPIRIVVREGNVYTLDNRRLYGFEQAGVNVPYVKLDTIPKSQLFKFSTENGGTSILIRRGQ